MVVEYFCKMHLDSQEVTMFFPVKEVENLLFANLEFTKALNSLIFIEYFIINFKD